MLVGRFARGARLVSDHAEGCAIMGAIGGADERCAGAKTSAGANPVVLVVVNPINAGRSGGTLIRGRKVGRHPRRVQHDGADVG